MVSPLCKVRRKSKQTRRRRRRRRRRGDFVQVTEGERICVQNWQKLFHSRFFNSLTCYA